MIILRMRWQYVVCSPGTTDKTMLTGWLNDMGHNGWELILSPTATSYIFKRRLKWWQR